MRLTQDAFPRIPEATRGASLSRRMRPLISFGRAASRRATPSTPSSDGSAMEYPVAAIATTTTGTTNRLTPLDAARLLRCWLSVCLPVDRRDSAPVDLGMRAGRSPSALTCGPGSSYL